MSQFSPLFDEGCCTPIGACHIPPLPLIRIRQPIAAYLILLVVQLGFYPCSFEAENFTPRPSHRYHRKPLNMQPYVQVVRQTMITVTSLHYAYARTK